MNLQPFSDICNTVFWLVIRRRRWGDQRNMNQKEGWGSRETHHSNNVVGAVKNTLRKSTGRNTFMLGVSESGIWRVGNEKRGEKGNNAKLGRLRTPTQEGSQTGENHVTGVGVVLVSERKKSVQAQGLLSTPTKAWFP